MTSYETVINNFQIGNLTEYSGEYIYCPIVGFGAPEQSTYTGPIPYAINLYITYPFTSDIRVCNFNFFFDDGNSALTFNLNSSDIEITIVDNAVIYIVFKYPFTNGSPTITDYTYTGAAFSNGSSGIYANLTSSPTLGTYKLDGGYVNPIINSGTFFDSIIKPRG